MLSSIESPHPLLFDIYSPSGWVFFFPTCYLTQEFFWPISHPPLSKCHSNLRVSFSHFSITFPFSLFPAHQKDLREEKMVSFFRTGAPVSNSLQAMLLQFLILKMCRNVNMPHILVCSVLFLLLAAAPMFFKDSAILSSISVIWGLEEKTQNPKLYWNTRSHLSSSQHQARPQVNA